MGWALQFTCSWAIVKKKEVAKKMTKFMEISTIGVSKESQLRAAMILGMVSDSCFNPKIENFFEYTHTLMYERWQKLRQVVKASNLFSLQKYPINYCHFARDFTETLPGNLMSLYKTCLFIKYSIKW